MNIATRSTTTSTASPARLALMWFGIQLAWGAVLGISLQARTIALGGASSLVLYGAVSTAGALAAAFVQLLVGPWSDRLRRNGDKRIVFYAVGVAGAALALVAFYAVHTLVAFVVAFIALQMMMNLAIGPYQAILPDTVPPSRIGAASGWMAAMQSGGNAAGAILATLLGNTVALGVVMAALLLASAAATVAHVRRVALQPLPVHQPLRLTRSLVDLFISRAFVYVGFYTLLGYFFFYVRNELPPHASIDATTGSGICILLFTILGAAGATLAAKPADRLDERIVVTAGGSVLALCILALATVHALVAIPFAIGIAGIGWGIFLCADWAFACRLLPPGSLAWTMAIWNVAVVGPQIIAPALTTFVLARIGALQSLAAPRDAFIVASIEIAAGTLWIWRLPQQPSGK